MVRRSDQECVLARKNLFMTPWGTLPTLFFVLPACAGPSIIPMEIESRIDPTVSFAQVKEAPTTHVGTVIVLGGEVLDATRLKDRTRLTMLQLPIVRRYEPTMDRTQSQGTVSCVSNRIFRSGHGADRNPSDDRRGSVRSNH